MKVTYYPGCSLEGTARDYADSIDGVCRLMGIDLEEIPDWNCCGATAAHSINHRAGIELPGRNLELAASLSNPDLLVPCPMCFNRLKTAAHEREGNGSGAGKGPQTKLPAIWDLANFFATAPMLEKIVSMVIKPLERLKVVSYYGCMASRPPDVTGAQDCENPASLDRIAASVGATVIDWPYKTDCCGASLMISRPDMGLKMSSKMLDMARRVGAQAIVVSCQMCQANLDMYQDRMKAELGMIFELPVIYFTELIGIACGIPDAPDWLSRHFVDATPLLRRHRLI